MEYTELFDSASSSTVLKKQASTRELDYVNDILCNVELMYMDFSLGRARDIVNPHLFNQLESRRGRRFESDGGECRMRRKVIFDCVSESLDLRCRRYVCGGYKMWGKGVCKSCLIPPAGILEFSNMCRVLNDQVLKAT